MFERQSGIIAEPHQCRGGGIFGFISANAYFPDDSLSVTVLANHAPSTPDALLEDIARVVLGLPARAATPAPCAVCVRFPTGY